MGQQQQDEQVEELAEEREREGDSSFEIHAGV
jgi:hypothetical protein